ncbi:hypothetical protein RHSIM_Rhsim05G0194100 [Rhododendron simsii]|uniref:laccase n=1 Tax=Rhododendron simsii TaxID=118357 RepID=A0A834GXP4_RHOSS|nr:hypothetical protein RHSIM_Rhsim05G0194100 [Rhododendron simsii]
MRVSCVWELILEYKPTGYDSRSMPHKLNTEVNSSSQGSAWHGIRQLRSGWADGPAYITQCPIQMGQAYTYNFTITGQRGTPVLACPHLMVTINDLRAHYRPPEAQRDLSVRETLQGSPHNIWIAGEWWNVDPEAVINQALQTGGAPNVSDAYTINGLPGLFYNCSSKDTFKLKVKPGRTYLLRLINAAMNDELFFSIANHTIHTLTVVEADAVYVKPFVTDTPVISPGQTTNVLLNTKPFSPNATFLMLASPYFTGMGTFDNSTVAGILQYQNYPSPHIKSLPLHKPTLPLFNSTLFVSNFTRKLRSLANSKFPANVPQTVDKHFFFTVGLGSSPCPTNTSCQGPNGSKFSASVNNVSFALPTTTAMLQSHFSG